MSKKTSQQNIIVMAKKVGAAGRHAGSKPLSRLLKTITRIEEASHADAHYKTIMQQRQKYSGLSIEAAMEARQKDEEAKKQARYESRRMKRSEKNQEPKPEKKDQKKSKTPEYLAKRTAQKPRKKLVDWRKKQKTSR